MAVISLIFIVVLFLPYTLFLNPNVLNVDLSRIKEKILVKRDWNIL